MAQHRPQTDGVLAFTSQLTIRLPCVLLVSAECDCRPDSSARQALDRLLRIWTSGYARSIAAVQRSCLDSMVVDIRGHANMATWYHRPLRARVSRLGCRWLLHGWTTSRVLQRLSRLGSGCGLNGQPVSSAVLSINVHAERCRERPVCDPCTGARQARRSEADLREYSSSWASHGASFCGDLNTISRLYMTILKYPVSQIIFPMCISRAISLGSCAALCKRVKWKVQGVEEIVYQLSGRRGTSVLANG